MSLGKAKLTNITRATGSAARLWREETATERTSRCLFFVRAERISSVQPMQTCSSNFLLTMR